MDRVKTEGCTQFFSQCRNMYSYRIAEIIDPVIPYMVEQLLLTDRTPLIEQQIFKDSYLLSGECQLLPVSCGGTSLGVKSYPSAGQNHIVLCKLPPSQTAYPCCQLLQMKRFC